MKKERAREKGRVRWRERERESSKERMKERGRDRWREREGKGEMDGEREREGEERRETPLNDAVVVKCLVTTYTQDHLTLPPSPPFPLHTNIFTAHLPQLYGGQWALTRDSCSRKLLGLMAVTLTFHILSPFILFFTFLTKQESYSFQSNVNQEN